jgi:hypothetical protein
MSLLRRIEALESAAVGGQDVVVVQWDADTRTQFAEVYGQRIDRQRGEDEGAFMARLERAVGPTARNTLFVRIRNFGSGLDG